MIFLLKFEYLFNSNPYIIYIIIFTAFLLLCYLIYILVFSKNNFVKLKSYSNGKNNIRLFTIHYLEEYAYVVDKKNFKGKRKESLNWFFSNFTNEDAIKTKIWINEIIKGDRLTSDTLEVFVYVNKQSAPTYSIFSCTRVDREKGIIHLESRLFSNLKFNKLYPKYNSDNLKYLENKFNKFHLNQVNLYYITLFNQTDNNLKSNKWTKKIILTILLSKIKKYFNKYVFYSFTSNDDIVILYTQPISKNKAIKVAKIISKEIKKIIELNTLDQLYNFSIGIATSQKNDSFASLVKSAKELTLSNNQDENNHIIYNASNSNNVSQETIKDEIIKLIEDKEIDVNYSPLISTDSGHIKGYYSTASLKTKISANYKYLQDLAFSHLLLEDFLTMVYERINSVFINKYFVTGEQRVLFMHIRPQYYKQILKVIEHTKLPINVKTVLVITDKDIYNESISNSKFLNEALNSLESNKDFLIGLEFTSSSIEMSDEILSKFDYFIFNYRDNFSNLFSSIHEQILFQDLRDTLKDFPNGKLTAVNLTSWQSIEYFTLLGFNFVSGSYLGNDINKLPQNDPKKINKLLSIRNRN